MKGDINDNKDANGLRNERFLVKSLELLEEGEINVNWIWVVTKGLYVEREMTMMVEKDIEDSSNNCYEKCMGVNNTMSNNEEDDILEIILMYRADRDHQGIFKGRVSHAQLHMWKDYFQGDLPKNGVLMAMLKATILLLNALKRRTRISRLDKDKVIDINVFVKYDKVDPLNKFDFDKRSVEDLDLKASDVEDLK
ncbi:hypothetical protein Tco_1029297 [Tanacetum coccineum]|uniref:Uncharacterized protein n=1 Tax=Tanacetum coccineum TaxID=301880 RepID=A0ABQ5G397_9ASTR